LMLNDMLDELKGKLESAVQENEDDFFNHFRNILQPAYEEVQDAILEGLEGTFKPRDREVEEALEGMGLCDRMIHIFETYQPQFETAMENREAFLKRKGVDLPESELHVG